MYLVRISLNNRPRQGLFVNHCKVFFNKTCNGIGYLFLCFLWLFVDMPIISSSTLKKSCKMMKSNFLMKLYFQLAFKIGWDFLITPWKIGLFGLQKWTFFGQYKKWCIWTFETSCNNSCSKAFLWNPEYPSGKSYLLLSQFMS